MKLSDVTYSPIKGFGDLGMETGINTGVSNFERIISTTIGAITIVGGIWFIFQIFTGAVQWISSGSDKDGVQKAQKKFTSAVIGLIVLIFSFTLIGVVGAILGYDILNFAGLIAKIV